MTTPRRCPKGMRTQQEQFDFILHPLLVLLEIFFDPLARRSERIIGTTERVAHLCNRARKKRRLKGESFTPLRGVHLAKAERGRPQTEMRRAREQVALSVVRYGPVDVFRQRLTVFVEAHPSRTYEQ